MGFDTFNHLADDSVIVCVTMRLSLIDSSLNPVQSFFPLLIASLGLADGLNSAVELFDLIGDPFELILVLLSIDAIFDAFADYF